MKNISTIPALLSVAALTFAAVPTSADPLSVLLTPEGGASVIPGNTLIFDASFTNLSGSDYLIDNATFSAGDPGLSGLLSPLFTGPYTVAAGAAPVLVPDVFELTVDPSVPPDTLVQGDLAFSGAPASGGVPTGPDVEAASAPVQFNAGPPAAVPEPSALTLASLGVLGLLVTSRRRLTRRSSN